MNYELLCDVLRSSREYKLFLKALMTPYGKDTFRPSLAEGLADGAFQFFLLTLANDLEHGKHGRGRLLAVCPDEKEASRLSDFLKECGAPSVFFPAKDLNFNNVTASHDIEHERLSVLSLTSDR